MKSAKRLLTVLFILCACVGLLAVTASAETVDSGTCGKNLTWVLTDDGTLTISGTGRMTDYETGPLVPWSDYRSSITSVIIEDGVPSICDRAFFQCEKLSEVSIPDGVTEIGDLAFYSCSSLKSISIPDSVTTLEGAFSWCKSLNSVKLSKNLTVISSTLFSQCTSLTQIEIPEGVTRIGHNAFAHCPLVSITLPDSVEEIWEEAFSDCTNLKSITFPCNVSSIEDRAFSGCTRLKEIYFEGDAPSFPDWVDEDHGDVYDNTAFQNVTATVYYPEGNSTWTKSIMQDYGGDLTWKSYKVPLGTPEIKGSSVASSGKPRLSWNKCSGAVEYQVYRATSKNGTYKKMKTTTGTSYTNTNAKVGKTYYYYVVAVDSDGNVSEKSNIVNRTCDCARPEVTLTNVASTGKIKIKWEAVEGAESYEVYRATSKSGEYKLLKETTGTSLTNTSAKAGKTYYYKVKAIGPKEAANSAYSEVKNRTCDLPRPDVTVKLNDSGKPKLSWDKIDGAVEYKVYRATSKNGDYSLLKTVTGTSLTNGSAKSGKTYYYKVKAIAEKSAANSAYSAVDSIKVK